jgi:hypothetical protein
MTVRWGPCFTAFVALAACSDDPSVGGADAGADIAIPSSDSGAPWVPPPIDAGPCAVRIKANTHDRAGRPMAATLVDARPGTTHRWTIEEPSCLEALPPFDNDNLTFTPAKAGCTLHISVTEEGHGASCSDSAVVHVDFSDAIGDFSSGPQPAFHEQIDTLAAVLPAVRASAPQACGGRDFSAFCPLAATTRGVMAALVLGAKEGSKYAPPACGGTSRTFLDVGAVRGDCPWIEELARRDIVSGCGGGNYCPDANVTREQASIFLLRTKEGDGYTPPACSGTQRLFADVPASSGFCPWIEELARRGIATGCGGGNFCPANPILREQAAAVVVATFALTFPKDSP